MWGQACCCLRMVVSPSPSYVASGKNCSADALFIITTWDIPVIIPLNAIYHLVLFNLSWINPSFCKPRVLEKLIHVGRLKLFNLLPVKCSPIAVHTRSDIKCIILQSCPATLSCYPLTHSTLLKNSIRPRRQIRTTPLLTQLPPS